MKPHDAEPPVKAVSGLDSEGNPRGGLPAVAPRRALGFPVSVAEFLLLFRLRVRRRSALSSDMLKRALDVVLVTCKSWFSGDASRTGSNPAVRR